MKKWIPVIIILAVVLIAGAYLANLNNKLVPLDENVQQQWGNVESSYQRRADLIPNIVSTAQRYAEFEQETLTKVIEARSKATSVTIDPTNITPEKMAQFQEVQGGLTSALARLLAVFERYPDLKANENFKELINELERTENRINVERNRYNEVVNPYNVTVNKFPAKMFVGLIGFEEKPYYKAEEGSDEAPDVETLFNR
ncbi:LemA family protein [Jejudonia soesokkakensis]|uniref:LemA family protein n=1 Tax=Jejudonia soesokkakensis TaxID=1323432 RepID=A0ABW2MWY9_9FLAO